MKKIIVLFILGVLSPCLLNAFAQDALNKGVYSIGGSLQYSSQKQNNGYVTITTNTGTIAPRFVYFIASHISLGAAVSYNYYFYREPGYYNGDRVTNISYITMGSSIRYYFNVKKFIPFLEASFNYGIYWLHFDSNEHVYNYGIKGGAEIFLSGSVALEPSVSYNHIRYTQELYNFTAVQNTNTITAGIGINYFIF